MKFNRTAISAIENKLHRESEYQSIDRLQDLYRKFQQNLYPSLPPHALPRLRVHTDNSNGLTSAILKWLECNGHKCWRQSSEGKFRPGETIVDVLGHTRQMKGQYLPGSNKGHGDVCAIVDGKFVSIEVKIGQDRQSPVQRQFQAEVEASAGIYWLVGSLAQFLKLYDNLK